MNFRQFLEMAKYNQPELEGMGYEFRIENELPRRLSILCYKDKVWIGETLFTQDEGWVRLDNPNWDSVWDDTQDALKPGQMWVMNSWVDEKHRRLGIASAMYRLAEKVSGNKIIRTTSHTPDSDAIWMQKNRPFGVNA